MSAVPVFFLLAFLAGASAATLWYKFITFAENSYSKFGRQPKILSSKMSPVSVFFLLALLAGAKAATLCTDANIELVARIVFGEARGEPAQGQLAVAYSVVNRVAHPGYPNTVSSVVHQTYGSHHQYNTLDVAQHNTAWEYAKAHNTIEYQHAKQAAGDALCGRQPDPTTCATDYCARDPCSATSSNHYYEAYNKQQIGNHYFVCRRAVSG